MIIHEEYLPEGEVQGNRRLEQLYLKYADCDVEVERGIAGYKVIVTKNN